MAIWTAKENILRIESPEGELPGCASIIFGCFGSVFLLISVVSLANQLSSGEFGLISFFYGFMFLFGLLALLAIFNQKHMNHASFIWIDRDKEAISFDKRREIEEGPEGPVPVPPEQFELGLGEIDSIRLVKVMKSREIDNQSTNRTRRTYYATYQIFLLKRDGALFWLDTDLNKDSFIEHAKLLYDFLQLPMHDESGFGLNQDGKRTYTHIVEGFKHKTSSFVQFGEIPDGLSISLKKKSRVSTRIMTSIFALVFFGIPLFIFGFVLSDFSKDFTFFPILIGLVVLVFLSIASLAFLVMFRQFKLSVRPDSLFVEMIFPTPLLQFFLGRKLEIPRDAIRAVRVNRLDEGHFWLTLALDVDFPMKRSDSFLFRLRAFSGPESGDLVEGQQSVGLWDISGLYAEGEGATFFDLCKVEKTIEEILQLDESA